MRLRYFHVVLAGDIGTKGLTGIFILAAVRFLPAADLATFLFLAALVTLSTTPFGGLFNRLYMFSSSVDSPAPNVFRTWQCLSAGSVYIVLMLTIANEERALPLLGGLACAVAASNFDFKRSHAQKNLDFRKYSSTDVFRTALQLLLALPVFAVGGSQKVFLLLGSQALAYVGAALLLPSVSTLRGTPFAMIRLLASRHAVTLLGYFALMGLLAQLPIVLVKRLGDVIALAEFGSAMRYYGLALGVVVAANVVMLPRDTPHNPEGGFASAPFLIVIAGISMVLVATVVGFFAIPFIDDGRYGKAPIIYVILSLGLIPGVALAPITSALMRDSRSGTLFASEIVALATCSGVAWMARESGNIGIAWCLPAAITAKFCWLRMIIGWSRLAGHLRTKI